MAKQIAKQSTAEKFRPKLTGLPKTTKELLDEFVETRDEIKRLEERKHELQPIVMALIPRTGTFTEPFMGTDGGKYEYTVTEGRQDRRKPDEELLINELHAAGIKDKDCMKLVPDDVKVTLLMEEGRFSAEAFARTLAGPIVVYPDVRKRKAKF